jgi:pimeloyl-ACP methyl ester carboxylesterase
MRFHGITFAATMTCCSRATSLRYKLVGRPIRRARGRLVEFRDVRVSRHWIASGASRVDAVYVEPVGRAIESAVLICHGIGEIVDGWLPVQRLLAAHGVASLVFDYSGYGRSKGPVNAAQFEGDAVAAFQNLQGLAPGLPVAILGFSLGSGVAAAIVNRVEVSRLVLCASFTSFREAALSIGVPRRFAAAVPDIWRAAESLRDCPVPVLVVHGDRDRLFPVTMAAELKSFCGPDSELVVVPNLGHNEPFHRPQSSYWGMIVSRLTPALEVASL